MHTPQAEIALLAFLKSNDPTMRDEDHPELADGSAACVRKLRAESDAHISRIFANR
jgi:hypothetical protein